MSQKNYCKANNVSFYMYIKDIPRYVKLNLINTECLDLYGSQMSKYSKSNVNTFYII